MARRNPKPNYSKLPGTSPVVGPKLPPGQSTHAVRIRGETEAMLAFVALSPEERGEIVEAWHKR